MRIAIIGSRNFNDYQLLKDKLSLLNQQNKITLVVSGGAKGADTLGEKWAIENNVERLIFKPNYDLFGRKAPLIRNKEIIDNVDYVIAFWDGESRGTMYAVNYAKQKGIKGRLVKYKNESVGLYIDKQLLKRILSKHIE